MIYKLRNYWTSWPYLLSLLSALNLKKEKIKAFIG